MNKLSNSQIRFLRSKAHALKPVILMGANGLTDAVMEAIEEALGHHELIKIRVRVENRDEKQQVIESICKKTGAAKIQNIGHVLTLYKSNDQPGGIELPGPKARR